jgi:hypothetical protein
MKGPFIGLVACVAMLSGNAAGQSQQPGAGLKKVRVVAKLLSPISTKTSNQGDMFTALVEEPPQYQGATLEGKITKLVKPKKGVGKEKSSIVFEFDSFTMNGNTSNVAAELKDVANSHGVKSVDEEGRVIGRTSNAKRAAAALGGAGLGALIGGLAGGGRGAAAGSAVGLAAGLAIGLTMTTTGSDIEFMPGSHFTLEVSDRTAR